MMFPVMFEMSHTNAVNTYAKCKLEPYKSSLCTGRQEGRGNKGYLLLMYINLTSGALFTGHVGGKLYLRGQA